MKPYLHFEHKDKGKVRTNQEDYIQHCSELDLFVLADGAGGHADGEVASRLSAEETIKKLRELVAEKEPRSLDEAEYFLKEAIRHASHVVDQKGGKNPPEKKMCSTIVAVWVRGEIALVANVGDSRGYLVRPGSILQLTTDHNFERVYINEGHPPEKAKRMYGAATLYQALGGALTEISVARVPFGAGDRILVCSDGLTNMVDDSEIHQIVAKGGSGDAIVSRLVNTANDHGGRDNISVILIQGGNEKPDRIHLSLEVLQQNSLFRDLTETERNELLAVAKYEVKQPGEILMDEGTPAKEIWILLSGSYLVTHKDSAEEKIQPIAVRKGGEIIGHTALFKEATRSATLKAVSPIQALTIHREDFFKLAVSRRPQIGNKIMLRIIRDSHIALDTLTRAMANSSSVK